MMIISGNSLQNPMQVDFSYAFAVPHRLTVALPDSSDKTLLDLYQGWMSLAWSYDNLVDKPLAAFVVPKTDWEIHLKPEVDGQPFATSRWQRAEGWLPALENTYQGGSTMLQLDIVGGSTAAMVRITVANAGDTPHTVALNCIRPGGWSGYNPAWVQPEWDNDVLLAGWQERADRILIFALGGDQKPVRGSTTLCLTWFLQPGEKRTGWIIRPYKAYHEQLVALRASDWEAEFQHAKSVWRDLIAQSARITIPDPNIVNAFYACLADCFIMREPVAGGHIVTCPGTELYRAPNPFEPLIVSVLFDQLGLHEKAAGNSQMFLDQQGKDGNWADPAGWAHAMWGASGIKSWAVMEHFRLTGDLSYLAAVYPRMLASSRWQETQRSRTRILVDGQPSMTYGLMPRGMGDGGLMNDDDFYGVFFTHNILAVYADAQTIEVALLLGKADDLAELHHIHQVALADLLQALERGAIQEESYRWIPGVPAKTSGSCWGVLYSVFPCGIFPPDHDLISGTIRKLETRISQGGLPLHTGWMKDGMWVAITLDNLAEILLVRGEGDAAIRYLYAALNHGTPLYTWCEERGQESGTTDCSGDRQHLWTPVAVSRFLRDAMVLEQGDTLHLARGAARQWLGSGQPLGVRSFPTHFGKVSFEMQYDESAGRISGFIEAQGGLIPELKLHIRLPVGQNITLSTIQHGAVLNVDEMTVEWRSFRGTLQFELAVD